MGRTEWGPGRPASSGRTEPAATDADGDALAYWLSGDDAAAFEIGADGAIENELVTDATAALLITTVGDMVSASTQFSSAPPR